MANITKLAQVVNGAPRNQDLTSNALVVLSLTVGGGAGTSLTKTILDNLVNLQNGSEVGSTLHIHDTIYTRTTALASTTAGSSGAKQIGVALSATNYSAAAQTVEDHLVGIHSKLGTVATNSTFSDGSFAIQNTADNTKKIAFSAASITTGTTRTITMPDANVDLGNLTNSNISASAAIAYSKLNLSGGIVNADINSAAAIAYSKLNLASSVKASDMNSQAATSTQALFANGSGGAAYRAIASGDLPDLSATYVAVTQKGAANGVASLDGSGKVPVSQLPSVVMEYQGAWNPNTNSPALSDATGTNGYVYYVSAAKSSAVSGLTDPSMTNFQLGDLVIYSSSAGKWQLVTPAAGVSSVNGSQGAVTVNAINQLTGDVTAGPASGSQSAVATIAAGAVTASKLGTVTDGVTLDQAGAGATIEVKAGGISNSHINASAAIAYSKLSLTGSIVNADISASAAIAYSKLSLTGSIVNADIASGAAIAYSKLNLSNSIVAGDITAQAVTAAKIATSAVDGTTITGGNGTALSVQYAPGVRYASAVAGQAFSANTTYAVRWGQPANGETAGRLYACDKNAATQNNYNCVGVIQPTGAVSAGGTVTLIKEGLIAQASSDTAFSSTVVGQELVVGSSGAVIAMSALAGSTNEAVFVLGVIANTTQLDIGGFHLRGIN